MEYFSVGKEFNDFKSLTEAKKLYEKSSNSILCVADSKKLKGNSDLIDSLIYERIILKCKALQVHLPLIQENAR